MTNPQCNHRAGIICKDCPMEKKMEWANDKLNERYERLQRQSMKRMYKLLFGTEPPKPAPDEEARGIGDS